MVAALMNVAPTESAGYCSPNGWIDADLFVIWLEHFTVSTNACTVNQQIIIMDGYHSHKILAAIIFARSKGITASSATSLHTQDAATRHNVLQITVDRVQQRSRQLDGHQSRLRNVVLRHGWCVQYSLQQITEISHP